MQIMTLLFAAFVLVGGVMGYKKKGSRDSLIASSILAGLLVMSAGLMSLAGNSYGVRLAAVTTGTLGLYMANGFIKKKKLFPQGVLAGVSFIFTIGYSGSLASGK
eukprot:jgi/Astpho2/5385/Aster-05928